MNKYQKLIDESAALAESGHRGQFRNDGRTPYFNHIKAVSGLVVEQFDKNWNRLYWDASGHEESRAAFEIVANFHDHFEDAPEDFNKNVITWFRFYLNHPSGEYLWLNKVLDAIYAISKKPKGQEEYIYYLTRVKDNLYSRYVKIADLTHNMSDLGPGNLRDKYSISKWFLEN